MRNLTLLVFTLTVLYGCSEGGIGGTGGTALPPAPVSQSVLVTAGSSGGYGAYAETSFERWGGLTEDSDQIQRALTSPFLAEEFATTDAIALPESLTAADAAGSTQVTRTNLIVNNVDEADVVKYDGNHLYLANGQHLTILETSSTVPEKLTDIRLVDAEEFSSISNLYLDESTDQLVAIRGNSFFGRPVIFTAELSILPVGSNEIALQFVDVSSPANPVATTSIEIEGNLVDSRRIDSTLFVISRYQPFIEGFRPYASDEKTISANEELLEETDLSELIPSVTVDGTTSDLIDPESCLIPNPDLDVRGEGQPTLTIITAISMTDGSIQSTCLADQGFGVHMTDTSLYIAAPGYTESNTSRYFTETTFHKFNLGSTSAYVASGTVPGTFWGDPAFLMAEQDNRFTVITTTEESGEIRFAHRLSILEEDSSTERLEIVGNIPNDNRPEAIGKPGEQIFASRIIGDRAYVVTFEQIDPVYAIDLSNPTDPMILGELEIPGFSSYLHPVTEDLLIGIGSNTRNEDGFVINDGVNIRLFNVADPANIELADEFVLGRQGSYSHVSFDYKAFTYQAVSEQSGRFALPVTRHGAHVNESENQFFAPWTDTALHLFEVTAGDNPAIAAMGQITAEDFSTGERFQPGCCRWGPRSFFNGDTIYYLNKSRVFQNSWTTLASEPQNLFFETQFANPENEFCAEFLPEPISVSSIDLVTGDYLTCFGIAADPEDLDALVAEESCDTSIVTTTPVVSGPGSYAVSVEHPGYHTRTVEDVRVTENECFLGTTHLNMYLAPE